MWQILTLAERRRRRRRRLRCRTTGAIASPRPAQAGRVGTTNRRKGMAVQRSRVLVADLGPSVGRQVAEEPAEHLLAVRPGPVAVRIVRLEADVVDADRL